MADNNRNWGGYRSSNQDWNDENSNRYGQDSNWDDRNSNRGRYEGGRGGDWGRSDYGQGSTYGEGRYNRDYDYNRGSNYGSGSGQSNYDRDYSNYGSNYGSGSYSGSQRSGIGGSIGSESGFGSRYNRERQAYAPGGYQNYGGGSGYGANEWTGGYGGSNYGRTYGNNYGTSYGGGTGGYSGSGFGDSSYGRSSYGSGYGSSGYGSGYGSSSYGGGGSMSERYGDSRRDFDRDYRGRGEDRGWWDRTTDEISSWFGDEEAERRRRMDRIQDKTHKGRGPKNYHRSDERIKEDINDRLSDDWYIDASEVDVTVQNGEVTLSGTVDERTSKRRAEDIAESVSGVRHVENRLRVASSSYTSSETSSGSTGTSSSLGSSTGTTGMGSSSTTRKTTVGSEVK